MPAAISFGFGFGLSPDLRSRPSIPVAISFGLKSYVHYTSYPLLDIFVERQHGIWKHGR